jgi:hypothetical protein
MVGRRFLQSLGVSSGIRWRAAAIALGAIALVLLLAWHHAGRGGPASADSTTIPATGLDFSIGIDVDGDTIDDCDTSGGSPKCDIAGGNTSTLKAYLNSLPVKITEYEFVVYILEHSGLNWAGGVDWVWPDAQFCLTAQVVPPEGAPVMLCQEAVGTSTYTGLMVTANFACKESGSITIVHGFLATELWGEGGSPVFAEGDGTSETLSINCIPPLPPPGDADGDGCPDQAEAGPDEFQGGRRNFLNPWDYFNPTNDGQNRVDDIMAVLDHYYLAEGEPGYDEAYDRSYLGPDPWNLGAPDGQVLVDDIRHAVNSYFHDCAP